MKHVTCMFAHVQYATPSLILASLFSMGNKEDVHVVYVPVPPLAAHKLGVMHWSCVRPADACPSSPAGTPMPSPPPSTCTHIGPCTHTVACCKPYVHKEDMDGYQSS